MHAVPAAVHVGPRVSHKSTTIYFLFYYILFFAIGIIESPLYVKERDVFPSHKVYIKSHNLKLDSN